MTGAERYSMQQQNSLFLTIGSAWFSVWLKGLALFFAGPFLTGLQFIAVVIAIVSGLATISPSLRNVIDKRIKKWLRLK